jgi:CRISPR-associated protein (TIGR02584 family)
LHDGNVSAGPVREQNGKLAKNGRELDSAQNGSMKAPIPAMQPSFDDRLAEPAVVAPDPRNPATFPRRILLAVTGLSPQVVTETLYALAVKTRAGQAPFIPTEIQLITTSQGREQAMNNLLSEQPGWFHRLRADYNLPEMRLDAGCIHVMPGSDGQILGDTRSLEDNGLAADFITEKMRELTSDADTALHVSLAGGRKTMGFYLGYALSLFGRAQDRLSHVMVSSPYESNTGFYYPPPYELILQTRDHPQRAVDARNAEVVLAEIPIVYLRDGLPDSLLAGHATFNATVAAARSALAPTELEIDVRTRRVRVGSGAFKLSPAQFAMLVVFAYRASRQLPPLRAPVAKEDDWSKRYLQDLRTAYGTREIPDSVERSLESGVDERYFSQQRSKLHRELQRELGPVARNFRIAATKERPGLYRLAVAAERIRFGEINATSRASEDQKNV